MKTVNLKHYGNLADVVSTLLNGADLRCTSSAILDRIESIAQEHNDIPVLYVLTPYTDDNITDEDLAAWEVA